MKKITALLLALLVVFMASCKTKPTEIEVTEDEKTEDESYTSDESTVVSPEQDLQVFWDEPTGDYGYRTQEGEIVIPPIFSDAHEFSEGLAAVCREDDGPIEYIDANGDTVIKIDGTRGYMELFSLYPCEPTCDFSNGIALLPDSGYCIDKNGNRIDIDNPCGMYKSGLIAVRDPETKLIGYSDIDGNIVVPCKYYWARDFEPQGIALVFSEDFTVLPDGRESKYRGYINTKGEEIIPLEYHDDPDCGSTYIYPVHEEINGNIVLYKDGYFWYFSYDGTLVDKTTEAPW